MTAFILLISCSLFVAVAFLLSFIWSVKNGQYDDTLTPSIRMLFDDTVLKKTDDDKAAIIPDQTSPKSTTTKNPLQP